MAAKPTYYWDACLFYEWLGNESVSAGKRDGLKEILNENEQKENLIITSSITHLEVLPRKLGEKGASDEEDYLALFDGIHFHEIELNANIILRAREIRDFYFSPLAEGYKMMDLGDCLHLATASLIGADEFHTRDKDKKGSKVPLLDLYEISRNPKLCGKYDLKILSPEAQQGDLGL
ncbi:MAG: type II toxin-antitoxin system VapC family toxin [Proteobacteria bacterium]|nr:MAG: type II toxin-antitoxin system VapC family toxin [Pseudomonadota bacterium]